MTLDKPIYWQQGLFLQPHHFQHLDAYHTGLSGLYADKTTPFFWGVEQVEIDDASLANGVFALTRGLFVFKDQSLVNIPNNAFVSARRFEDEWQDKRQPLTIYLGIRKMSMVDQNVTVVDVGTDTSAIDTRFVTMHQGEPLPDLYQKGDPVDVQSLHYVVQVFFGHELEQATDYELLPIARVIQETDGYKRDPAFVPPSISISGSKLIWSNLSAIKEEVIGRVRQLEEYKGEAQGGMEFSHKLLRYRLALMMLSRYGLLFDHYLKTPTLHPWHAFGLLCQLAGELSAFTPEIDSLGNRLDGSSLMDSYNHADPGPSFQKAMVHITRLLNEITVGSEMLVGLQRDPQGQFSANVPDTFFTGSNIYYLVLRTQESMDELLGSFATYAKIGSQQDVNVLLERALPGLNATPLKFHPEGLPRRPDATYFRLTAKGHIWESVQTQRNIAMLWNDAPVDLKVELIVAGV